MAAFERLTITTKSVITRKYNLCENEKQLYNPLSLNGLSIIKIAFLMAESRKWDYVVFLNAVRVITNPFN